jgi:hypothetical protein
MNCDINPAPGVIASFHNEGVVLFHTSDGRLFSANRVGACIWRGLQRSLTTDAIVSEISREYRMPEPIIREHTARFLLGLERQRLIRRSN